MIFKNRENMIVNMHVGDTISIQDFSKDGRVQLGVGKCKDPLLISIYGANGMENCIVVTIIYAILNSEDAYVPLQLHDITDHHWEMIVFGL